MPRLPEEIRFAFGSRGAMAKGVLFGRLLLVMAWLAAGSGVSIAFDTAPDKFQQKLQTYDPAAVEAARAYAKTLNMKAMLEKSVPLMSQRLTNQLKARNPTLSEDKTKLFVDTFLSTALVDNSEVLEQATTLLMLDIFDKNELLALYEFYSSPVGSGFTKKFPTLMGRIPEMTQLMQTYVVPRALEAAKAKLKESGVDVKI